MHDRNGLPLAVGDKVLFEGTITQLSAGEDFCNVAIESDFGRRPDGAKEHITAINTGVLTKVVPLARDWKFTKTPAGEVINCGCGKAYHTATDSPQCPDHAPLIPAVETLATTPNEPVPPAL